VSELVEEIPFSTDSAGTGTVTVQPAPASQTVEVCDDDGCVYGDAEIQPAAGDGASDVEGDEAPTATDAVDFDTDGGEAAAPVGDESGGTSSPLLWILLAVIVVAGVIGGVFARSRRTG
jgi:hypothetical protein